MTDTPIICFLSESRCNYKTPTKVTLNGINLGEHEKNDSIKVFLNNDLITDIVESTSSFIIFNVPKCNKICTKKLSVSVNDIMSNAVDFSYCPEITSISKDSIINNEICEVNIYLDYTIIFNKTEVYFGDIKCDNITNVNNNIITLIPPLNSTNELNTVSISVIISGVECINKIPFTYIYSGDSYAKSKSKSNDNNTKIIPPKASVANEDELSDYDENKVLNSSDKEEEEEEDHETKKSSSSSDDDEEHITKELLDFFKIKMKYQKIKQEYKKAKQNYEKYMNSSKETIKHTYATAVDVKSKYNVVEQTPSKYAMYNKNTSKYAVESKPKYAVESKPKYAVADETTPKYETPKYAQASSIYADPSALQKNVSMDIKKKVTYAPSSSSKMNLKSIITHTLHSN